eukprot:TRINITY_DN1945_c0_g1_i2.p1 TRINITY_DN1945_c0_g1~~TRINITY_DN1945_c0_g1_i2.p1  ORF type:complete len:217 (+),score=0.58 TRINITY_DN1945_c0_g1_i2:90-740(+)
MGGRAGGASGRGLRRERRQCDDLGVEGCCGSCDSLAAARAATAVWWMPGRRTRRTRRTAAPSLLWDTMYRSSMRSSGGCSTAASARRSVSQCAERVTMRGACRRLCLSGLLRVGPVTIKGARQADMPPLSKDSCGASASREPGREIAGNDQCRARRLGVLRSPAARKGALVIVMFPVAAQQPLDLFTYYRRDRPNISMFVLPVSGPEMARMAEEQT